MGQMPIRDANSHILRYSLYWHESVRFEIVSIRETSDRRLFDMEDVEKLPSMEEINQTAEEE
ncbi:hypothetical protein [Caballeronia sp. S22]|uniref:hypothetical protein n=1 Tax=Caballeronia sp. S22 TaxID=3137182 RepID=UPI0035314D4C